MDMVSFLKGDDVFVGSASAAITDPQRHAARIVAARHADDQTRIGSPRQNDQLSLAEFQ
jgi:pyridoxal biosynthesis lyase PdxS